MDEHDIERVHEVAVRIVQETIELGDLNWHDILVVQASYDKLIEKLYEVSHGNN